MRLAFLPIFTFFLALSACAQEQQPTSLTSLTGFPSGKICKGTISQVGTAYYYTDGATRLWLEFNDGQVDLWYRGGVRETNGSVAPSSKEGLEHAGTLRVRTAGETLTFVNPASIRASTYTLTPKGSGYSVKFSDFAKLMAGSVECTAK